MLGACLFYSARTAFVRYRTIRRQKHGLKAEAKAAGILKRHGYQLIEEQPQLPLTMYIDSNPLRYTVRPDGVAIRKGRTYFVEVKTGAVAGTLTYGETRRQLLEYFHGSNVDGVLFVNADQGSVNKVQFPRRNGSSGSFKWKIAMAFTAGVALGTLTQLIG